MSDQHGSNFDEHKAWWPARPENADKVFGLLVATCVGLIIFDFVWHQLPHEHHPHFVFETMVSPDVQMVAVGVFTKASGASFSFLGVEAPLGLPFCIYGCRKD